MKNCDFSQFKVKVPESGSLDGCGPMNKMTMRMMMTMELLLTTIATLTTTITASSTFTTMQMLRTITNNQIIFIIGLKTSSE